MVPWSTISLCIGIGQDLAKRILFKGRHNAFKNRPSLELRAACMCPGRRAVCRAVAASTKFPRYPGQCDGLIASAGNGGTSISSGQDRVSPRPSIHAAVPRVDVRTWPTPSSWSMLNTSTSSFDPPRRRGPRLEPRLPDRLPAFSRLIAASSAPFSGSAEDRAQAELGSAVPPCPPPLASELANP